MSISIGDAVLTFRGDTTELDAAFNRVNAQARGKLAPANLEIQQLSGSLNTAGGQALVAGESVAKAGVEAQVAAQEVQNLGNQFLGAGEKAVVASAEIQEASFSMREAKNSAGLLSEAAGVKLPRDIRGFIAELPGVGKALESAFSAVAIYFVIDAIIQASQKLTQFIIDTFIFTEAMKKSDAITKKMNQSLVQHSEALKKLKDDYLLLGLNGIAKTTQQMSLLNQQIKDNANGLKEIQTLARTGDAQAQADLLVRTSRAKELQQQLTNLEKQGHLERLAAQKAADAIRLAESKTFADIFAAYDLQAQRLLLANRGLLNTQGSALDVVYREQLFQNELDFLAKKKAATDQDSAATKAEKEQANKAILDLETKHQTEILKLNADTINGIRDLVSARLFPAWQFADDQIKTDALKTADEVAGAFQKFFDQNDRGLRRTSQLMKLFQKDTRNLAGAVKFFGDVGKLAFAGFEQAAESAIAGAILGQESFGIALRKGTAEVLANIAAQALIYSVFYLAYAFGKLAQYDFTAATQAFISSAKFGAVGAVSGLAALGINPGQSSTASGSGGGNGGTASSASQPDQTPVQAINVQHFAGGGLITRRTMALIGDAPGAGNQREAIVPLGDDSRALDEIASRIYERMGGGGTVYHQTFQIEGLISGDNLKKVVKQISHIVGNGGARLNASNSLRVTKRS